MNKIAAKILLIIFLCLIILPVNSAIAAETLKPEFNPLCWEKKACEEKRAQFFGEDKAQGGWLERDRPECDKEGWGKCIASASTKAQISFGGSDEFTNVGEYIKTIYNYSLAVIGILAVVVIIIAGAQWITSAGNAEVIGRAKKRITGAIIGIFIAYMSFVILESINPATVNLRLPNVYMIREMVLPSKWCKDYDQKQAFAYASDHKHQSDDLKATGEEYFNLLYPHNDPKSETFWCGQRYYIEGTTAETFCWGDRCGKDSLCTDVNPVDTNNPYMCRRAVLVGDVEKGSQPIEVVDTWEFPWVNEGELVIICNDGTDDAVGNDIIIMDDEAKQTQSFMAEATVEEINEAVAECNEDYGGVKGFVAEFDVNSNMMFADDKHRFGKNGKDIGLVYTHLIGGDSHLKDLSNLLPEYLLSTSDVLNGHRMRIKAYEVKDCFDVGVIDSDCEDSYETFYKPR